tara:strand:- start:661 stop:849 length:189 start_codon:yes stop_codon:yes gene_type:complete
MPWYIVSSETQVFSLKLADKNRSAEILGKKLGNTFLQVVSEQGLPAKKPGRCSENLRMIFLL